MKIVFAIVLAMFVGQVSAETYVQINGASVHNQPGFNGFNYGAGVEQTISKNWTIAGGWYRNSEYRGSAYGYARYSVYREGPWDIGVGAGLVSGYSSYHITPMAFPEVCYNYLCAIAIPQVNSTGASALALHLRIPVN
jgi:hypothetical protein